MPKLRLFPMLAISGYQTNILIKEGVPFRFPSSPALALLIKDKLAASAVEKINQV